MGWWTDLAEKHPGTPNHGGPMIEQRGMVEHIAAGTYAGTIAWQMNPTASVSSHFVVAKDGRITQMLDTTATAWTQRDGNGRWVSVENEGQVGDSLTPQQVEASARLFARGHKEHGWPLQIATAPSGRGLGHHSMGAENGIDWGHSACPGAPIKAQKPAIVARAIQFINGPPKVEDDMATVNQADWEALIWRTEALINNRPVVALGPTAGEVNQLAVAMHDAGAPTPVTVDAAAVAAALAGNPDFLAGVAKAVNDDNARRMAQ